MFTRGSRSTTRQHKAWMQLRTGLPTPDRTTMQRDFINKLLAGVPEKDRWLLVAKEIEGFSIAELSEMTGLNEHTVKGKLFRVRQDLVAAARRLRSRPCSFISTCWNT